MLGCIQFSDPLEAWASLDKCPRSCCCRVHFEPIGPYRSQRGRLPFVGVIQGNIGATTGRYVFFLLVSWNFNCYMCLLVLRFARFRHFLNARCFEKMLLKLLKLYWPDCFFWICAGPNAGVCARLRYDCARTCGELFDPNRSQILKMLAICDFGNNPGFI